jgi:hypothetical protein
VALPAARIGPPSRAFSFPTSSALHRNFVIEQMPRKTGM